MSIHKELAAALASLWGDLNQPHEHSLHKQVGVFFGRSRSFVFSVAFGTASASTAKGGIVHGSHAPLVANLCLAPVARPSGEI